jgi:peptide/nickel transport system substrate-binding protein/oligopeptide transport system substrate-binding protein
MRAAPILAAGLTLAALALSLAGCGSPTEQTLKVVVVGDDKTIFSDDNPASAPAALLRSATAEGLLGFDEQGRVVPALADRWIVLDDGQSYIFRLREGTWRGGRPLTGQSAQVALREAIARLKGTALALDLATIDDIRVMAARVIEIRLRQPTPELLQLLAQPELGLVIRKDSAGPMAMVPQGKAAELTPIRPEKLGLPAVRHWNDLVRPLHLAAADGRAAVEQFSRGDADLMIGGTAIEFPLASALGIGRGAIRMDAVAGLFGLAVMNREGLLEQPAMREALAMAIDRDALVGAFGVTGWTATSLIVPPDAWGSQGPGGERWAGLTLDDRRARAGAAIAEWRREHGGQVPALRIALPSGPGADLIFLRLAADFSAIDVPARRVAADATADLRLVDKAARYGAAIWYLNQFNCSLKRGACDPATDALMDQVRASTDAPTRDRLSGEAAASLTAANVFIPLAVPLRWSLVRGDTAGFSINRLGFHPLMALALHPR